MSEKKTTEERIALAAGAVTRTALAAVGGYLVGKGVPADWVNAALDPVSLQVAGALTTVGVLGWSLVQKFKKKALDKIKSKF